jgi:tRNA1Val (adenine37-N6)-methyltransferase
MANNYFNFKQFTINQDLCGQKVGTDGVILGAWADIINCEKVLDIGSGTGLIALMLAQKSVSEIIAIEIDKNAYQQSKENIENSKFSVQIKVLNTSIQEYSSTTNIKFDLIVSNPPFFQHHLKSENEQRKIARHSETLNFEELINSSINILDKNGRFCVIIPKDDEINFTNICFEKNLFLNKILNVKPTPSKLPKRVLLEFSFENSVTVLDEIIIEENGRHQYSEKYKELTKDFYINF